MWYCPPWSVFDWAVASYFCPMLTVDQINALQKRVDDLKGYLSVEQKRMEIAEDEKLTQDPEFWNDPKEAEKVMKRMRTKKGWVQTYDGCASGVEDLSVLFEFMKAGEASEDEVIRERAFRISDKLDIGDIVDSSFFGEKDVVTDNHHEEDEALGNILDPFYNKKGKGEIQRDGTVKTAPESDMVTDLATDGERGINWILMGTMILVYSAIGIQIGFVFEPMLATFSLIFLFFIFATKADPSAVVKVFSCSFTLNALSVAFICLRNCNFRSSINFSIFNRLSSNSFSTTFFRRSSAKYIPDIRLVERVELRTCSRCGKCLVC